MNPASMQALVDAQAQGQAAQSQGAPPQQQPGAQKWQGDTDDPASSDPDFEKIQSGVFDMSPEELDVLKQMIDAATARLQKQNPDPGGNIKL
jgi:hypothetical protein